MFDNILYYHVGVQNEYLLGESNHFLTDVNKCPLHRSSTYQRIEILALSVGVLTSLEALAIFKNQK